MNELQVWEQSALHQKIHNIDHMLTRRGYSFKPLTFD